MNIAGLVTVMYYIVFSIYIFLGVYVLTLNYKGLLNRLFAASSFLMSLWAIGFSISASASTIQEAFIWRRVSAIGWSIVFSVILHFVFALVKDNIKMQKINLKHLIIIYFPAIINLIIFSFSNTITMSQYNIVNSSFGFTNIPLNNLLDLYYNIYYVIFVFSSVFLLYIWGFKKRNINKKSAIVMALSFVSTMIIATVSDRLVGIIDNQASLQLAPIVIFPTIYSLFYAVQKHGSFLTPNKWRASNSHRILTLQTKKLFSKYLSILLFIGSILSFIYQFYLYQELLIPTFISSFVFLIITMCLYILPHTNLSENTHDIFFVILASFTIPYMLLKFALVDASITIWVMPFFFIFLSVLYVNKIVLLILTITTLVTYILIWLKVPNIDVTITGQEHILRIVLLILVSWFAFMINKIYIQKLKENEQQLQYQQLMATVSSDMLSINIENMNSKLIEAFEKIGFYSDFQRIYILNSNNDMTSLSYDIEWCHHKTTSTFKKHNDDIIKSFDYIHALDAKQDDVYVLQHNTLPLFAKGENSFMTVQQAKTSLLFPIRIHNKVIGLLGMDSLHKHNEPSSNELKQYKTFTNIISDAFQKTIAESDIQKLAYYDTLTQLPNRLFLNTKASILIDQMKLSHKHLAVFFIDLDGFKLVNDSIGHTGGDELLILVSKKMSQCISEKDLLCRYSGDEFILVIPDISTPSQYLDVANNILTTLREKIILQQNEFMVTSSIGISLYPNDGESIDTLIRNADLAMYDAKLSGKNQFKLCSDKDKEKLFYRNKLIQHLQHAIENNEFIVYYQPQINIASNKIIGFEALLRWNNSELGFIPPSVFIPLAEQCGLIKSIGQWVFEDVCQQYQNWTNPAIGKIPVAVNISSHQFKTNELVDFIKSTLDQTQMDPKLLELEVTESVAIKDKDDTIEILNELKTLGLTIAIDDFGTEYSSLSRLKDLPIDRIKIAMKFIHGINVDSKDEAIINVIIYLAQKLGLNVIAEGVENIEQVNYLRDVKCDDIQGYYYHKPMPSWDIETLDFS